jgi:ABC-type transporter Mla MlaB component
MLKLFQSIFRPGADKLGTYPEDLIERAIERAVDGTDRRLRAVSGYQKRLRPAVIHAIDHVVALVDKLPPPLPLDGRRYGSDAELSAYFASVNHMNEILSRDAAMRQWQKSPEAGTADTVFALLLMDMHERNVLGVALEGNELRHDVAQVTVSFSKHRMVDPAGVEDDARRLLKRRAFDHLLTLALAGIAASHGERGDLTRERDLLRSKQAALASGHWGFGDDAEAAATAAPPDPRMLEQRIREIDAQLGALSTGLLQAHLDVLVDVMSRAEQNLHGEAGTLCIDRQGVKQAESSGLATPIPLTTLHNSAGRSLVMRLTRIARADLPPPPDFLREAQRYLG